MDTNPKEDTALSMNHHQRSKPVIVFDLGGVLMDWSPYYLYCDQMGLDQPSVDRFLEEVDFYRWNAEQDRGRSFAEATPELCARFPQYTDLIRAYDEHFLATLKGAYPPVVEILGKLKAEEYPLYVLSNWSAETFKLVRPQYPFFDWFDGMVISGEVGLIKPDPAIYQILLERAGRPAGECLFIDDHLPNIQAASALGFQTIQFQSAGQLESELHLKGILGRVN
jgi:2-haloacid dehalogenase